MALVGAQVVAHVKGRLFPTRPFTPVLPPVPSATAPEREVQQVHLLLVGAPPVRSLVRSALSGCRGLEAQTQEVLTVGQALEMMGPLAFDCVVVHVGDTPDPQLDVLFDPLSPVPVVAIAPPRGPQAEALLVAGVQDLVDIHELAPERLERVLLNAIGRHRRLARLTRVQAELADRNRDLDEYAHTITHDLKAPLRAIHQLVGEAAGLAESGQAAASQAMLAQAGSRVELLFARIDQTLSHARARRADDEPVPAERLVADVVADLAPRPGLTVTHDVARVVVHVEPEALRHVVQNLVDNALRHHDLPQGRVHVAARDAGPWLEFVVADDGPGIPEGLRERAFVLFDTLGKDTGGASGVGLALVRRLVEARGGAISLEGNEPRGCFFRFTWPNVRISLAH